MLGDDRILGLLQQWMLDDKAGFLVRVLAKPESSLGDVANALRRFQRLVPREEDLPRSTASGLKVSLIRRFLTDQLEFISVAKENVEIADFQEVVDRLVLPARSHGKLGGKSAGLFLARQVLTRGLPEFPGGLPLAFPKSWYVVSDGLSDFVEFNGLQEWVIRAEVQGRRIAPAGIPASGPPLQELHVLAGCGQGAVDGPGRFRHQPSRGPQFEPGGRSSGYGLLRQVQEPLPGEPGDQAATVGGAARRHRRDIRFHLRSGRHRVPARAGPTGLRRRHGHPAAGSGGRPVRQVLLPLLRGGGAEHQRVPLVSADRARGRPAADRARARHPGGGPSHGRLPGAHRPRPARSARQRHGGGGGALRPTQDRRDRSGDQRLRIARALQPGEGGGSGLPRVHGRLLRAQRRATASALLPPVRAGPGRGGGHLRAG